MGQKVHAGAVAFLARSLRQDAEQVVFSAGWLWNE
jgi:hypothetical protein